jgi:hypothetical protein
MDIRRMQPAPLPNAQTPRGIIESNLAAIRTGVKASDYEARKIAEGQQIVTSQRDVSKSARLARDPDAKKRRRKGSKNANPGEDSRGSAFDEKA